MSEQSTTTVFSTTTMTSTKILTRTILTQMSFPSPTNGSPDLSSIHSGNPGHHSTDDSLYPYHPSLPLSIIFTILYCIATVHHGYLCLYLSTKPETLNKHKYTIPLFIASLLSTAGYFMSIISTQPHHNTNLALYTASSAFIIVSPIFFCASLYILLTRLITRCLPPGTISTPTASSRGTRADQASLQKFLFLPPSLLSILLITSDTLTFIIQAFGAAWAASNSFHDPQLSQGTQIMQAGIALQLSTFLLFLLVLHLFCLRVRKSDVAGFNPCIMKVVIAVWVASGFVLLRTAFRLVAFASGPDGYAFTHEWCLYVFEAFPIWIGLMVLGWWHPVKWIQERVLADVVIRKPVGVRRADVAVGVANAGHEVDASDANRHVRRRSKGRFGFGF